MVVRVAQQAKKSGAQSIWVAADDVQIMQACANASVPAVLTDAHHQSGTDRLAQAVQLLKLNDDEIVVNVQGDEPFIEAELIQAVAKELANKSHAVMSTAAHLIYELADLENPNIVKVVANKASDAIYFSRSRIPFPRDAASNTNAPPTHTPALRHIGIYAYRVGFLKAFASLTISPLEQIEMLEQLRALWHGHTIALYVASHASPAGVDTPEDLRKAQLLWNSSHSV